MSNEFTEAPRYAFNPNWRELPLQPPGVQSVCAMEEWSRKKHKLRRAWLWQGELVNQIQHALPEYNTEEAMGLLHLLEMCGVFERVTEPDSPRPSAPGLASVQG